MEVVEIRDVDAAREYLLQGLWLQRVRKPAAEHVKTILHWVHAIASDGHPLPPVGVVADLGAVALGLDGGKLARDLVDIPSWPSTLARSYEDHLLGKLYSDWTFERASDAPRRYTTDERPRGLAYLIRQYRERAKLGGVELSPAVIRGLLTQNPDELLKEGYQRIERDRPLPVLVRQYEQVVAAARRTAELLELEDVIALEQRTALADMGQYVAHRQVLHVAAKLAERLPSRPVSPQVGRREVPTRVPDEDQYPVGGYASIGTRGSIESLLHSQLAYMEPDERPDQFDVKFVRDELFYYTRDENQFLRRRRTFAFVFDPDLHAARVKDPDLPCQRIVMAVAAAVVLVRKLSEWLTNDACRYELIFPRRKNDPLLRDEAELLELLLTELRANKSAVVLRPGGGDPPSVKAGNDLLLSDAGLDDYLTQLGRTAQLQVLTLGNIGWREIEGGVHTVLGIDGPAPTLTDGFGQPLPLLGEDPLESWVDAVTRILHLWV